MSRGFGKEKGADELRRGWTTGACATAATQVALRALLSGEFTKTVTITLPRGETPEFPVAQHELGNGWAEAGITKDAGDDPDVTHGALILVKIAPSEKGIIFKAGEGVGIVTKEGLPIGVGEPAINPVPRSMISEQIKVLSDEFSVEPNFEVTVSIPGGEKIAQKTWNPRLGIKGGLSILGTTGIVRPFSCAAWIASIHRGIDVARAEGLRHVAGCTGSTSEDVVRTLYGLPEGAMLDMGDFSGGLLKYLAKHPVKHVTIGGGFGKIVKLAQGAVDLHSGRSQVDFEALDRVAQKIGCATVANSNTAMEALQIGGNLLANKIANMALEQIYKQLRGAEISADVVIIDRAGNIVGQAK